MVRFDLQEVEDDECAKVFRTMNPPRVVIDNDACETATVIKVDSMNKHGTLLEVVRVITDLNLVITKGYICSDGRWFMDVFNVINCAGNKVLDQEIISKIKTSLESDDCYSATERSSLVPSKEHTSIELTATDRPGLFSQICAVLADLGCNVVNAEIWTYNSHAAAVIHITDRITGSAIEDADRLSLIRKLLFNVLRANSSADGAKTVVSMDVAHMDRRLHQMMYDDRDYETEIASDGRSSRTEIMVQHCPEKDYSIVVMRCKDRPKLLFDTVCMLTDMQYVVFHGMVRRDGTEAFQEYYIRHIDGMPIRSDAERKRVIQCLEAAIERRTSVGLELELRIEDRLGLLSDITRIFRENGLTIRKAEISTEGSEAVDRFCVTETTGDAVQSSTIEYLKDQIGSTVLQVKQNQLGRSKSSDVRSMAGLILASLFRVYSFGSFRFGERPVAGATTTHRHTAGNSEEMSERVRKKMQKRDLDRTIPKTGKN